MEQARVLIEKEGQYAVSLIAYTSWGVWAEYRTNVSELLQGIFSIDASFKLVLNDFGPEWLIPYSNPLQGILGSYLPKIDHLALPIQSLGDRILERITRRYTK